MSPALPDGDAAPDDGALPASVVTGAAGRAFGLYLHVPFCTVRCGYCDFNTYTANELGGGANQAAYADTALREIELARAVLARSGLPARPLSTVFVGGGTPTVLPPGDLARMLEGARSAWGLAPGAEVTTEANPDSVTPASLAELARAGFTRVSFGMQSAVPRVLATLERTHDPRRIPDVVRWAKDAGLAVSLDLIYGTPGESVADWRASVEAALATGVDHVSAYALVVEQGTKMAAQVRRGELALPTEEDQAAKYELADAMLAADGLGWYEVSNWARTPAQACRHNLAYWRGDDWWGIGPGAHSHVGGGDSGGVRWWNVKHPRAYAQRLESGVSPAAGRETLDPATTALERVMLGVRLSDGLALADVSERARHAVAGLVADGLLDGRAALGADGGGRRALLTLRGRLLADAVIRELTD
ncbi:radical SAM family heme chaperone HemW [Pengzhenrongella sicca]|uniref:Heme chaperone HemW n=1 Tax=Pengzhenrongella sicca TaxID=2819238 RepID=A0A8A4ZDD0_9MICO|nr:radical SAM family heme chaperone HemW [Pengzhenrongella sicca]QTE28487.1 coproporphyrinogen III oxidase [Pengzhenrongella sicca]